MVKKCNFVRVSPLKMFCMGVAVINIHSNFAYFFPIFQLWSPTTEPN